ncbi:MFS transporter [Thermodesulfobacteriota bacterium]
MKTKYFYGYNIVAAGFVIQAVCFGSLFTYGLFFREFQAEFEWSRTVISGAWSLAFFIMGPVGILAGRLNDRIGPRIIIISTGISLGIGYILMSTMDKPWQLYLYFGMLVCMGFGAHDVITLSTVARWFVKRRGMMSGIVKVGTGVGQLLIPMIVIWLINSYGWRSSYAIMGSAAIVIFTAAALALRRDPYEMGFMPDGCKDEPEKECEQREDPGVSFKTAVKSGQFWALCLAELAAFTCLLTIVVHIVPHATDLGLSSGSAGSIISIIGGASMLGRILIGSANDRIGGKRSLIICFSVLLFSLVWLQCAGAPWMLFVFGVVCGFAHGGFFTIMSPTVAELFGTRAHGVLFGIVLSWGTLGGAAGPLLAGHFFDVKGNYNEVFMVLIGMAALGLTAALMLKPVVKRISQE